MASLGGSGLSFIQVPAVSWANLPAAGSMPGGVVQITNVGPSGAGSFWVSNGTRWYPWSGMQNIASLETPSANVANSETIVFQYLIPAGVWQVGDTLRLLFTQTKSGTTDTGTRRVRVGTAGTTADTQIVSDTVLIAANRSVGSFQDFRLSTATTVQPLGGAGTANGSYNASATAYPSAVTVSSAVSNALYVSLSVFSSSTNDTVAVQDVKLQLSSSVN